MKVSSIFIIALIWLPMAKAQDNLVPYVFELKSGKALHGNVNPDELNRISVDVFVEEPWDRVSKTERLYKRDYVDAYPESEVSRKVRIDGKWEESGKGVKVETATGMQWVFKTDLALAQRALAADTSEPAETFASTQVVESVDATPMEPTTSGGIGQWWLHGLIVLGTAFLGALIVWFGFIRRSWSNL